ncbi:MAG: ThuA domain-containing protein [Prosthecobacter sp.]|jgi:type 1 glutamine amidotransferase|uniref:ThuA domain-containing protein n=1 Tax=Prosthecobacter sp. TaxID=1965333 RepID=UPI001A0A74CB|nr:ThuA domain-containing protein [Prosthecobacter sp.]MBE2282134.1 ThuA domain-containing protein [Prosthecobacter sp.]
MKLLFPLLTLGVTAALFLAQAADPAVKPLRVLVVAGGCCHEYDKQTLALKEGIEARLNAIVDVAYNPDKTTKATFEIYKAKDWAKDFDVIVHDECSADVTDPAYVNAILDAHKAGKPAVNLHCAMHSYRWGNFREPVQAGGDNARWYEFLGLQSTAHGPKEPISITYTDKTHPITQGLEDWKTINEELYNNIQILGGKPLASGVQIVPPKAKKGETLPPDAKPTEATAVVAWTNEFGPNKTKTFSTTIGHNTETVADARYLDLVTRGILWVTGHINENGKAEPGYGK